MSSDRSFSHGRFLPGVLLGERYRIVGLLGQGGMGEVYRADDLKLGQAVALKFLPEAFEAHPGRRERLLAEVRIARQISHANVCRVYDVGEAEGRTFISMEYVDGEDLGSLLKRIGRLPKDKAIQVARQLCAGLGAAHEQGVLHRDLKPANIMLDGRGRARITDFGLAVAVGDVAGAETGAGTPGYMAPEQHAGKDVTVRSDIYALGLVLYELFTGQPAFKASTPAELARLQASAPTSPASVVEGFDPAVERAILRCLESDPRDRPSSALQVAASLPGGDPLAAALAAGETPSPEMVAAAGEAGGLRPLIAWGCFAGFLAGLALHVLTAPGTTVLGLVGLPKPPDALVERAEEIARTLGYSNPPLHRAHWFEADGEFLNRVEDTDKSADRWQNMSVKNPAVLRFVYRGSPRWMVPQGAVELSGITAEDPPRTVSGMVTIVLDPTGRLVFFEAIPPERDTTPDAAASPDWSPLLAQAGQDGGGLLPVPAIYNPLVDCDARAAWTSPSGMRYEAGGYRGRPVYFEAYPPWRKPSRMEVVEPTLAERVGQNLVVVLVLVLLAGGALLARRNLRLGRGDRRGALRLVAFLFVCRMGFWALRTRHVPDSGLELGLLFSGIARSGFDAGIYWMLYVALEPFVRRMWPDALISWSRALMGRMRDPLVGRDLLIGCLFGVLLQLFTPLSRLLDAVTGFPPTRPSAALWGFDGVRGLAVALVTAVGDSPGWPLILLFFLVLFRVILRRPWLATLAVLVVFGVLSTLEPRTFAPSSLTGAIMNAVSLTVLIRFGVVALITTTFTLNILTLSSITSDLGAWYAGYGLVGLVLLVALALYGFRTSLAGRPLFGQGLFDA